jgi:hypothetical protein
MKNFETKTMDDVMKLAKIAKSNNIKFEFYPADDKSRGYCVAHYNIYIYADMTPTEMWQEINNRLAMKEINVYQVNFDDLKEFIES